MEYNKADIELVKQYKAQNMSNKTILALINKTSNTKYTENDILNMLKVTPVVKDEMPDSRLYDIAAGIVFNPEKRKRIKNIAFITALVFIAAMLCLGIFVSWKPVLIIMGSMFGLTALIVLVFFVLLKAGILEKIMERHGF